MFGIISEARLTSGVLLVAGKHLLCFLNEVNLIPSELYPALVPKGAYEQDVALLVFS